MQVHVHSEAGHESQDGVLEDTKEQGGSDECDETGDCDWSPQAVGIVGATSAVLENEHKGEAVNNNEGNFTEQDEDLGDVVGESESKHVLDVQKESFPGTLTEAVTGNGDVGESSLVDVVADLLNAGEDAFGNADDGFDQLVASGGLLGFLGEVQEDKFDEFYQGNDESSSSDTSGVVDVSKFDRVKELSLAFLLGVGVEVVSGGCSHDHELGRVGPPGHDPEDSEEHTKGSASERTRPMDFPILWNDSVISSDRVQSYNACERVQPNQEGNQGEDEVEDWYTDDSLVFNSEVSSSIDDIDGFLDVLISASDTEAEAASDGGETDAAD